MARLEGKTAFVTAAGQGIGRATALAFAAEGARLIATDINAGLLASLAKDAPGITTAVLDVRDTSAVHAAARALGPIDILFNCAGYVHHGAALDCDEAAWDLSFDINIKSMWRTLHAFLPDMIANGGGSIVNMASVVGAQKAAANRFVYGTTKAAVIGLTKSVALDYQKQGVRCNCVCPGTVQSPSLEDRITALPGTYVQNKALFMARQPGGRFASAEEIAALIVYLASDEASFTTGSAYVVDGGWSN